MSVSRDLRSGPVTVLLAVLVAAYLVVLGYGFVTGAATGAAEDLLLSLVVLVWGGQIIANESPGSLRSIAGGLLIVAGVLRGAITLVPAISGPTPIPELVLLGGLVLYLYVEFVRTR